MRQETFPSYEEREKKCASVCVYVYVCVRINVCKWGRSTVGQGAAVATKKKKKHLCACCLGSQRAQKHSQPVGPPAHLKPQNTVHAERWY